MTDKTFEELFPELKDKEVIPDADDNGISFLKHNKYIINCSLYEEKDIIEHCLSKQKVEEAIQNNTLKNINNLPIAINGHFYVRRDTLLKELGLE
jgi:hypothetical protein